MRRWRCRWQTLDSLKKAHVRMLINGLFNPNQRPSNMSLTRELLVSSAQLSSHNTNTMHYTHKIFRQIPEPDLFMWNTIIKATARSSNPSLAITRYYDQLTTTNNYDRIRPDSYTFIFLLKACANLSSPSAAAQLHVKIVELGFGSDVFVRNALINVHASCGDMATATTLFEEATHDDMAARCIMIAGYAKRGQLCAARRLFDETQHKDTVSWNIMITGYAKQGQMDEARQLFDVFPERDVVSWNAMVSGYARCGCHAKALEMYQAMTSPPDEATVLCLLLSCADSGDSDVGESIHRSLTNMTVLHGNALINMYAKCGRIERAVLVFEQMRERDVWTWNSVIGGLALHGYVQECVCLFSEMQSKGVTPNEITFVILLGMCSHEGMVEEGRRYLSAMMSDEYGLKPSVKHYGCVVDMLGRAGLLEEAFELVRDMMIEPSAVMWRTLLGACKIHGNVELGRLAKEKLVEMGCDKSGDYVVLSNMYSSVDEWHRAENVRKLMDVKGARKEAGCSLT